MAQVTYSSSDAIKEHEHKVKGFEIFVGGMARSVTESMVHETLVSCGEIVEIRIMKDQKGDSKGFGFVRFATKEAAFKAQKEKNGYMLQGKKIGIALSTDQDSLFLGSLPKDWSFEEFDKMVHQAFQGVLSVDLAMSSVIGDSPAGKRQQNRGFGIVQFSSHSAAARAYRLGSKPDFLLGNCHPVVDWAEKEPEIDPEELVKIKVAFVGNLPKNADEGYLKKIFQPYGKVEKVALSRKGRYPVGFVHFSERSELDNAIKGMDGRTVEGPEKGPMFKIQVTVARPAEKDRKRARDETENKQASKSAASRPMSLKDGEARHFPDDNRSKALRLGRPIAAHGTDPYEEAVASLPTSLAERLLKIFRLGIATRYDIDIQLLTSLKELPESAAITVLDKFMLSCADGYNKGRQLAGLIARHQVDNTGLNWNPVHLAVRTRDSALEESGPPSLPGSRRMPVFDPLVSRPASTALARYDHHTTSPGLQPYSSSVLDDPFVPRSSLGKLSSVLEDPFVPRRSLGQLSSSVLDDPFVPRSSFGKLSSSVLNDPSVPRTGLPKLGETGSLTSYETSVPSIAYGSSLGSNSLFDPTAGRILERPQVKFDPFTGQPYKFDPFTGEPIKHETYPSRSGGHI
ncbi:hypothetical protein MRB53_011667 [Persea americana]|uniref:Uncharacterized protein n=1 Tax=Persea americana TaxID=3435 RepID=A0ACC2LVJ5_PERAE|nr:hypothetical protein MRB53_011667 [Persea americana]